MCAAFPPALRPARIGAGIGRTVTGFSAVAASQQVDGWAQYFPCSLPMMVLAKQPHDCRSSLWIRASYPVEIYLPHIRSAPANAGPGSTRASMRWSGPRKWKKTLARRWPPAEMGQSLRLSARTSDDAAASADRPAICRRVPGLRAAVRPIATPFCGLWRTSCRARSRLATAR